MGAEQSHQAQGASTSLTTGDLSSFSAGFRDRDGALSPRQDSVCSDSEVPYVSYTVSKPIGDSPKKGKSSGSKYKFSAPKLSQRSASTTVATPTASSSSKDAYFRRHKNPHNTLVVVNKAGPSRGESVHQDPDLARLSRIPTFLPVMRASLSVGRSSSVAKDPDILEKLDPRGYLAICQRYQSHLKHCAGVVSTDQAAICKQIREIDTEVTNVTTKMADKHKQQSKHAEQLKNDIKEVSKALAKCHLLLNENIEQLESLNNMLPSDERLSPFVWTTG